MPLTAEFFPDDPTILSDLQAALSSPTASLLVTGSERAVRGVRRRVLRRLKTPPGPVVYPILWASDRQRRAFFATNGFGAGIPTRRTGRIPGAWKARWVVSLATAKFVLENPIPEARYVQGYDQQPFHRRTGWERIDEVAVEVNARMDQIIADTWTTILDPRAGVT